MSPVVFRERGQVERQSLGQVRFARIAMGVVDEYQLCGGRRCHDVAVEVDGVVVPLASAAVAYGQREGVPANLAAQDVNRIALGNGVAIGDDGSAQSARDLATGERPVAAAAAAATLGRSNVGRRAPRCWTPCPTTGLHARDEWDAVDR